MHPFPQITSYAFVHKQVRASESVRVCSMCAHCFPPVHSLFGCQPKGEQQWSEFQAIKQIVQGYQKAQGAQSLPSSDHFSNLQAQLKLDGSYTALHTQPNIPSLYQHIAAFQSWEKLDAGKPNCRIMSRQCIDHNNRICTSTSVCLSISTVWLCVVSQHITNRPGEHRFMKGCVHVPDQSHK